MKREQQIYWINRLRIIDFVLDQNQHSNLIGKNIPLFFFFVFHFVCCLESTLFNISTIITGIYHAFNFIKKKNRFNSCMISLPLVENIRFFFFKTSFSSFSFYLSSYCQPKDSSRKGSSRFFFSYQTGLNDESIFFLFV